MNELYPYVRTIFLERANGISWPTGYHRDHEVKSAIERIARELLSSLSIDDIIIYQIFIDSIFDEFLKSNVLREDSPKFAGTYYSFKQTSYNSFRDKFLSSDGITATAKRIGERFYPDVFQGYRRQMESELAADIDDIALPLPSSQLEKIDWSQRRQAISPAHIDEIRDRTNDLISAIHQADLDERTRENALAHARAVIDLLQAPDPPWEEIVNLLNNPVFCAVLNAAAILQLILGIFL